MSSQLWLLYSTLFAWTRNSECCCSFEVSYSCDRVQSPQDRHRDSDTESGEQRGGRFWCLQTHCHVSCINISDTLAQPSLITCCAHRLWTVCTALMQLWATSSCFLSAHLNHRALISFGFVILLSPQAIRHGLQVSQTSFLSAQLEVILHIQSSGLLLVSGLQQVVQ